MKVKAAGVDQSALALTIREDPNDRFRKQARRGRGAGCVQDPWGVSEAGMLMSEMEYDGLGLGW